MEIYDFTFFSKFSWYISGKPVYKCHVIKCINHCSNSILRHFDERQQTSCGTTVVDIWDYVHGELAVTFNEQTWRLLKNLSKIKTKITLKIGNFSNEQDLRNKFNRKYLYNSKMVVKFLTKLVECAKKKSTVYEIFRFFRFLIKNLLL